MNWAPEDLKYFVENTPDLLLIANKDGKILKVSPNWADTFGYEIEELEKMSYFDLIVKDHHKKTVNAISYMNHNDLNTLFKNTYLHKDGSTRHIEWRCRKWDKKGNTCCIGRLVTHNEWGTL